MTRGTELQRITREGKRIRTANLEVRVASPLSSTAALRSAPLVLGDVIGVRVGMIVPKHRQNAVQRNQLKRRLRELVRLRLLSLPLTADLVIRARPEAYSANFDALSADIARAASQLLRWEQDRVASRVSSSDPNTTDGDTP